MFPWSPEFTWDAGHVAFFAGFYGVLFAIGSVLAVSARRAFRDARDGRAVAMAWHATFEELPPRDRACRYQLTGEALFRVCDHGFDCRSCTTHPLFLARRGAAAPAAGALTRVAGLELPSDRFYHRGHTFVRPEADGSVSIGLDALGRRLVGTPERVELPPCGTRLEANGPAFRFRTRGSDVRVLAPLDGTVVGVSGDGAAAVLRVDPGINYDTRHLLTQQEAGAWTLRELERLQRLLGSDQVGPALADGGELLADLGGAMRADRREAVLGAMFLD